MRRALPFFFLAVSSLALASGCIPSRDNRNDPSRAPDVRVRVERFYKGSDGVCQGLSLGFVTAASRGDCLEVDVSATTDPQDHEMTYTYFVEDSGGALVATLAEHTDEEHIAIPRDVLGAPPVPLRRFVVRAKDSTGAVATGSATLALVNSPPVLPQPGAVLLPEGGLPWALGAPMPIVLDGRIATDVDGDEVSYCWTTEDTPTDGCEPFGATWPLTIDPVPGRHAFSLVVTDGDLDSEKRTFVVRVGASPLWDGADALRRFDETLREWPEPADGRAWIVRGELGEEWLLFQDDATFDIAVYRWSDLSDTGLTIALGERVDLLTSEPITGGGTRVWIALGAVGGGTDLRVYEIDENGTAVAPGRTEHVAIGAARVLSADAATGIAAIGSGGVMAIVPLDAGDATLVFSTAGSIVQGGGRRPGGDGDGNIQFLYTASGAIGEHFQTYFVNPNDGTLVDALYGDLDPMREFEWVDHNLVWSMWPGKGLTLYDVNSTEKVFAQFPDIQAITGGLHVDTGSGACTVATASGIVTVFPDGREERNPFGEAIEEVDFVASDGTIAVDRGDGFLRFARSGNADALLATVDLPAVGARRSPANGGVWAVAPPVLFHFSEDGRTTRAITTLDIDGPPGTALVDPVVAIDPGENGGWILDGGLFYRLYELEIDPFFPHIEEAALIPLPPAAAGFTLIGASSPASTTPFAWMANASTKEFATIGTAAGTFTKIGPLADTPVAAVVDPRTNDLCVFGVVNATTLRHHRITPDGVDDPDDVTVASTAGIRSPFTFASPEVCGVVTGSSPSEVLVWNATPALVARHVDADDLVSVTSVADGIYWAGALESGSGDRLLTRMVASTSGTFARTTWTIDVPSAPDFLP